MDWRTHQSRLKRHRRQDDLKKKRVRRLLKLLGAAVVLYLAAVYLPSLFSSDQAGPGPEVVVQPGPAAPQAAPPPEELDKAGLARIIGPHPFKPDELYTFEIKDKHGNSLYVRTTLNPDLQAWAVNRIKEVKAVAAALVVMDPSTGEVLAMASYRQDGRETNEALASSFPAASLFKIITAAAAVEKEKMSAGTRLGYDGGKYDLSERNIKGDIDDGRNRVTLREGFAQSINTVFGKLGAFSLGPEALEDFARRFGFNQPIPFEMPVQKSRFTGAKEEDYFRLAELASGFNRTTKVSPLHGAMLASAVINDGRLMEPTVVREVFDRENNIYYRHEPVPLGEVVSPRTVTELRKFMLATVREGTGRRRFWDAGKHEVLSRLDLGGKSGTINNDEGQRVDWFVSFAEQKKGKKALGLAAVVVHGPQLGLRSQVLIREAVIEYFRTRVRPKG